MSDKQQQLDYLSSLMTQRQFELIIAALPDPYAAFEQCDLNAIASIKGIGTKNANNIMERFNSRRQFAKVYAELYPYGLSVDAITTLIGKYNDADQLLDRIEHNPYILITEVRGIGWAKADEIARKVGIVGNDPRRIQAYVIHFLNKRADDGHTWCTAQDIWDSITYDLNLDDMSVLGDALNALHDKNILYWPEDKSKIGLTKLYNLEKKIAEELYRIANGPLVKCKNPDDEIGVIEQAQGWSFTDEQIAAVHMLAENNVAIVTGFGGCVDGETEFFTGYGWKKISDYQEGDKVLQYNEDGSTSLVNPTSYHQYKCDLMYHLHNASGSVDQIISEEHNVVYLTSKGNLAKIPAYQLYERHHKNTAGFNGKFLSTFAFNGPGIALSDAEIRVMCAVICDGHFTCKSPTSTHCRINIKKKRKQERIVQLLNDAHIQYYETQWNPKDLEYRNYVFHAPLRAKVFTQEWYNCTQHQLEIIIDEILSWDGTVRASGKRSFSTTEKETADFIQFAFTACGYRSSIGIRKNRIYKNGKREYTVGITQRKNGAVSLMNKDGKPPIEIVPTSDGYKYCFTVPSHMFVMRYNNTICVTGNTGKSSAVSAILEMLSGKAVAQCALSGRAAARLTEITGRPGMTIHRLLGFQAGEFTFNETNQLQDDIIILDEISMVGADLFYDLIKAIKTGAKLIMLGDDGQLESIGLCNIFKDMLDSGVIPTARLTKIHRQAAKSAIITESIRVRHGEQLCESNWIGQETRGELQDLTLQVYTDAITTVDYLKSHYQSLLDQGISKHRIQMVLPMKTRGDACTLKLNLEIQNIVNRNNAWTEISIGSKKEYGIRLDDRVICVKNMYKAERPLDYNLAEDESAICPVFNGDRGVVKEINSRYMIVNFDQWGPINIPRGDFANIELGYALSCHKLQGSEADYIIIGFDMSSRILLTKEWLYTAITRAKKKCILACQSKALSYCISNSNIPYKRTFLKELLIERWEDE